LIFASILILHDRPTFVARVASGPTGSAAALADFRSGDEILPVNGTAIFEALFFGAKATYLTAGRMSAFAWGLVGGNPLERPRNKAREHLAYLGDRLGLACLTATAATAVNRFSCPPQLGQVRRCNSQIPTVSNPAIGTKRSFDSRFSA
jgi:hypothetical protein